MAESKKSLEQAGGVELLRALGGLVVKGAKDFPGQVAARAHDLISAGGGKIDAAICAAVQRHLDDCEACRTSAAKKLSKAQTKKAAPAPARTAAKSKQPKPAKPAKQAKPAAPAKATRVPRK